MRERFAELLVQLHKRDLVPSASVDAPPPAQLPDQPASFFRFNEICQRSERRYDLRVDADAAPFADIVTCLKSRATDEPQAPHHERVTLFRQLMRRFLGDEYKLLYIGVVWSQPGSEGVC